MIRVEGHKHLYRDEKSGAIINCDTSGYMRYKKMKNKKLTELYVAERVKNVHPSQFLDFPEPQLIIPK